MPTVSIQGFSTARADLLKTLSGQGFELNRDSLEEVSRRELSPSRALKAERNLANNRNVEFFYIGNPKTRLRLQ